MSLCLPFLLPLFYLRLPVVFWNMRTVGTNRSPRLTESLSAATYMGRSGRLETKKRVRRPGFEPGSPPDPLQLRMEYLKWEGGELNHYSTVTNVYLQGLRGSDVVQSNLGRGGGGCCASCPR